MRRLFPALVLLVSLVACGGSKTSAPTDTLGEATLADLQGDLGGGEDVPSVRDVPDLPPVDSAVDDRGPEVTVDTPDATGGDTADTPPQPDAGGLPICKWDQSLWDKCVLGQ